MTETATKPATAAKSPIVPEAEADEAAERKALNAERFGEEAEEKAAAVDDGPAIFHRARHLHRLAQAIEDEILTVEHALAWVRAFPNDREELQRVIDFVKRVEAALNDEPHGDDDDGGGEPHPKVEEPSDTTSERTTDTVPAPTEAVMENEQAALPEDSADAGSDNPEDDDEYEGA